MSEALHTPGPWEAVPKTNSEGDEGTHWIKCQLGCLGYWKGHKRNHTDSNWVLNESDARLIAAAPDLLAALQACLDYGAMTADEWVADKAQSAIARATGKGE